MTWILVIYIYAGTWAKGDSVTLNSVDGFTTQAACAAAGEQSKQLVNSSSKEARFTCVKKQ